MRMVNRKMNWLILKRPIIKRRHGAFLIYIKIRQQCVGLKSLLNIMCREKKK